MRAVIQRVTRASITIDGMAGKDIGRGYVILLGIGNDDTPELGNKLWEKILKLRIFADDDGKTNLSLKDVNGEVMIVSQFTLYANCRNGNRPSFTDAAAPFQADELYQQFVERAKQDIETISTGSFGADMQVELVNDGPFTILLDTDDLMAPRRGQSRD
ncbi:D-aminoacyl-tRNA deacylase [Slackia heliotrinireducens]|uniref:D-aminoacyl-tRNA deacylase n=1 Tax=Slackia heliotrinireducens TaxID=84110 RepID=UPI00331626FD